MYGALRYARINEMLFRCRLVCQIRKEELMYWYAEMRPVKQVEDFGAEFKPLTVTESKILVQCQINFFNTRRSEGVAIADPIR